MQPGLTMSHVYYYLLFTDKPLHQTKQKMGLAQSKRSVNITTDPAKEGVVAEGTGKLEKIGEVDQLKAQANGDAQHNDGDNVSIQLWFMLCAKYIWHIFSNIY